MTAMMGLPAMLSHYLLLFMENLLFAELILLFQLQGLQLEHFL